MELILDDKAYLFEPCELCFTANDLTNVFVDKDAKMPRRKTLYETVSEVKASGTRNKYKKLEKRTLAEYGDYLDVPLGQFLYMLKEQGDDFYKEFLYKRKGVIYGDGKYCAFSIPDKRIQALKGLYAYCSDGKLVYIGKVTGTARNYRKRITTEYGKIDPKNCYLDGQNTNCRLNHLINAISDRITFYVYPMEDDNFIEITEKKLNAKYDPEWNL